MSWTPPEYAVVVVPLRMIEGIVEYLDENDLFDELVDALLDAELLETEVWCVSGAESGLAKHPRSYSANSGGEIGSQTFQYVGDSWWLLNDGECTFADATYWKSYDWKSYELRDHELTNDGFYNVKHDLWVPNAESIPTDRMMPTS